MKIAVLCDGAGLARLGLEQAGHDCIGFELDPVKHYLSRFVGSGQCELADVRGVDLTSFDAVWISAPCQAHSVARTQGAPISKYADGTLQTWALSLGERWPHLRCLWIENVSSNAGDDWGDTWNAAQFLPEPIQNRNRVIGGHHPPPHVYRDYRRAFPGVCPCITATEYKGCASDKRRASRFYGRRLTVEECGYHQGLSIPHPWRSIPQGYTPGKWKKELFEAIGNGVPVYMAYAFGVAAATLND